MFGLLSKAKWMYFAVHRLWGHKNVLKAVTWCSHPSRVHVPGFIPPSAVSHWQGLSTGHAESSQAANNTSATSGKRCSSSSASAQPPTRRLMQAKTHGRNCFGVVGPSFLCVNLIQTQLPPALPALCWLHSSLSLSLSFHFLFLLFVCTVLQPAAVGSLSLKEALPRTFLPLQEGGQRSGNDITRPWPSSDQFALSLKRNWRQNVFILSASSRFVFL